MAYIKKVELGPSNFNKLKKVAETAKFQNQQLNTATAIAAPRTSKGKISDTINHKIAPKLKAKQMMKLKVQLIATQRKKLNSPPK